MQPPNPNNDNTEPDRSLENAKQMAIEELKLLQAIIGRYDEHVFKVRNWATALAGAIVVARYTWHTDIVLTLLFAFIAILASLNMELFYRSPQRHAIDRVNLIEEYLRSPTEKTYDGPRISESMAKSWTWERMSKEFTRTFIWISYLILFVLVLLMVIGSCLRSDGSVPSGFKMKIEKTEKDTKTEVTFDLDASPQDKQKLLDKARTSLGVP